MNYTISPDTLRNLSREFRDDLANTYEHLNDDAISPSDLRYWEKRRELLLHMQGRALLFARDLEALNSLKTERMNSALEVRFREAAE